MKVKFTEEDMDALEAVIYDSIGCIPAMANPVQIDDINILKFNPVSFLFRTFKTFNEILIIKAVEIEF